MTTIVKRGQSRIPSFLAVIMLCATPLLAQDADTPATPATPDTPDTPADRVPIDTSADEFDYDSKSGVLILKGNAVIIRQDTGATLSADQIRFNEKTGKGVATGNVVVTEQGKEWSGDKLEYDVNEKSWTGHGIVGGERSVYSEDPFTLRAMEIDRVSRNQYVVRDVVATTCDPDDPYPPYRVKARKMVVTPGERIKGYGTTIYFGRVPVMWTPFWTKNLDEDSGWHLRPGYNSRLGAFLLSTYRTPLNDYIRSETHIDAYSERGVGLGQDFGWRDPVDGAWYGKIRTFYLDDDMPFEDDEDPTASPVDEDRYRIRVEHSAYFTPNDYFLSDFNYLSDPDVLEDFFDREYRGAAIPDNFASFTHRDDWYAAELLLRPRLNDFYEVTARIPEGTVTLPRQRIADSPYFYEGKTSLGYLERLFEDGSSTDDYSSFRLDSKNTLLYPTKQFGFLNVIPRVGYRATYYSDTRELKTETPLVLALVTNSTIEADGSTSTVVTAEFVEGDAVTREVEGSADLRNVVEFGLESSFKAFGMYESASGEPLRHVVEPRVNYTYVPEPDVVPSELLTFDRVDTLDESHTVTFGVRNKMQAKRFGRSHDLVDVDARTTLLVEDVDKTGRDFTPLEIDAEITAADWADVEIFIAYDFEESMLDRLSSELHLRSGGPWSSDLEYRYRETTSETTSLLLGELIYTPNPEWSFSLYGRHEFEQSELEEVAVEVQQTLDCLAWRAGVGVVPSHTRSDGSVRDDEWQASIEFWLTDFPNVGLGAR